MKNFKAVYIAIIAPIVLSCGNTNIELKNNWYIHDNIEADYLLENWDFDNKNRPDQIALQEYYLLSDSVIITKYNHNVPASVRYTIVNLYTFEEEEFLDKHLKSDRTVYEMFKNHKFIKP